MSDKQIMTVICLFILLCSGAMHIHRVYALGNSELAIPIVMRLILACALIVAVATKRYAMETMVCLAFQTSIFMMNALADLSFISH